MRPPPHSKPADSQAWCWWEGQGGAGTASCLPGAKTKALGLDWDRIQDSQERECSSQHWDARLKRDSGPSCPQAWG